ncbi:MAG: hypothetical protein H6562_20045 [Lewinellaceae bacterium]|nr:hypothetical protein [Lewinellaceae bacterium]
MSWFERLFGSNGELEDEKLPVRLGRYSDSYKKPQNYEAWDRALEAFESGEFMEAYKAFFQYLRDDQEDNVRFWVEDQELKFEIYQGSKKICGFVNDAKLKAEAKIAQTRQLEKNFMRKLVELNFQLEYSRFALDHADTLTIVFDTYLVDGSPYKLYHALKEMATKADKQDDLLLDEFTKALQPVEVNHLIHLPDVEKEAKYQFTIRQINQVLEIIESGKLNRDHYATGIAYLLLYLVYKLDYLVKPEGYMMETLERINRLYSTKEENKSMAALNQEICKEFRQLIKRSKEEFFKEMYQVPATFGITIPVGHDRIVDMIDANLHQMDWYLDNGHAEIAMAVPGFIVSYSLFLYAPPKPDRDLLELFFRFTEPAYFDSLGIPSPYHDPETGGFNKRNIKKAVTRVIDRHKPVYSRLNFPFNSLDYSGQPQLAKTYLQAIRSLDLTKKD